MDTALQILLAITNKDGATALIGVLILIVGFLFYERMRLLKEVEKKDEKLQKIIDDYYKGNMTISEAFTSLKLVLYEIKGKL